VVLLLIIVLFAGWYFLSGLAVQAATGTQVDDIITGIVLILGAEFVVTNGPHDPGRDYPAQNTPTGLRILHSPSLIWAPAEVLIPSAGAQIKEVLFK